MMDGADSDGRRQTPRLFYLGCKAKDSRGFAKYQG